MEYRCEDLPQYGVELVPASSPEFAALLADIEARRSDPLPEAAGADRSAILAEFKKQLANPAPGSPVKLTGSGDPAAMLAELEKQFAEPLPDMILRNRSQQPIAALSWIWKFEPEAGHATSHPFAHAGGSSFIERFGAEDQTRGYSGYWEAILPGSKRVIRGNSMFGDNTDVRPAKPHELRANIRFTGRLPNFRRPPGPFKWISLAIDGVFFLNGDFAGPDTLQNFDRVVAEVQAHVEVGKIAREGHKRGLSAAEIFARIDAFTRPKRGSAPLQPGDSQPADLVAEGRRKLASYVDVLRQLAAERALLERGIAQLTPMSRHPRDDGDQLIHRLICWADTPLPKFRKL